MTSAGAFVDVAGLALQVEAVDRQDLALVQRLVGHRPAQGTPDAILRIGPDVPSLPSGTPQFEGPYGDHWDDGRQHSFWHHWGLGAVIDGERAVVGGDATGHRRWVAVRNSMLFVLARLFYERGRFVLHGAAVRRGDLGVLLVGESSAGKSTLAYAATRWGRTMLADDMVVVDPTDRTMRGIPRVPAIPGEVARLTGATGETLPDDERDRVELVGLELDPRSTEIGAVVLCERGVGDGGVEPMTTQQAAEALVPSFVLSALDAPVRSWFPHAMALGRGVRAVLRQPDTVEARVGRAGDLLDQVFHPHRP